MISQKLVDELRVIFKEDYDVDMTNEEARESAENLVKYTELLIKIDKNKARDK